MTLKDVCCTIFVSVAVHSVFSISHSLFSVSNDVEDTALGSEASCL